METHDRKVSLKTFVLSIVLVSLLAMLAATTYYSLTSPTRAYSESLWLDLEIQPKNAKLGVNQSETFWVLIRNGTPTYTIEWRFEGKLIGSEASVTFVPFHEPSNMTTLMVEVTDSLGNYGFASTTIYDPATINVYLDDLPAPVSYVVKTDATNTWCVRYDGYKASESTNAATVINYALGTLTVGRTSKETVVVQGSFTVSTDLIVYSYTILWINGKLDSSQAGADSYLIVNSDQVSGNTQIEIIGGELDGNDLTTNGSVGIYFKLVTNSIIRDTYVHHISYTWPAGGSVAYGIYLEECTDTNVLDSRIEYCDHGGLAITDSTRCNAVRCHGKYNADVAGGAQSAHFVLFGTVAKGSYDCNIIDCNGYDSGNWGAQIYKYCYNCEVRGGVYEYNENGAVNLIHPSSPNTGRNIKAVGVTGKQSGAKLDTGEGIVTYQNESQIIDCTMMHFTTGITLESNARYYSVLGNKFFSCTYGVMASGNYSLIQGNTFEDCTVGVYINDGSYGVDHVQILNNILEGSDTGISVSGAFVNSYTEIMGNIFHNMGVKAIGVAAGNVGTRIEHNDLDSAILDSSGVSLIRFNIGYVTENSGMATLLKNGDTITHGLVATPVYASIHCLNTTYDSKPLIVYFDYTGFTSSVIKVSVYWLNGTAITTDIIAAYWEARTWTG